jgi:aminoglycoside phosphotransferase (APT) family kinase protein
MKTYRHANGERFRAQRNERAPRPSRSEWASVIFAPVISRPTPCLIFASEFFDQNRWKTRSMRMHADEVVIDEPLVRRLISTQMPEFGGLQLVKVEPWGTDNAVWRLGEEMVVRLPRIHWATGQIDLEREWLPKLAPLLPVALPEPIAIGEADDEYPWRWGVFRWISGVPAGPSTISDPVAFALDLVDVIRSLMRIPTDGAPPATNRARPVAEYNDMTLLFIDNVSGLIDADAARRVWEAAMDATPHEGPPVWVQGDLEGNCVVREGRLSGIVDWGSACAGDPAVDIQVVWSPLFTDDSRQAFLRDLGVDDATLARSRGAAVHQACGALGYYLDTYPLIVERSWHKLAAIGVQPKSRP